MPSKVKPDGISFKEYIKKSANNTVIKQNTKRLRNGQVLLKSLDINGYLFVVPTEIQKKSTIQKAKGDLAPLICSIDKDDTTLVWLNQGEEAVKASSLF